MDQPDHPPGAPVLVFGIPPHWTDVKLLSYLQPIASIRAVTRFSPSQFDRNDGIAEVIPSTGAAEESLLNCSEADKSGHGFYLHFAKASLISDIKCKTYPPEDPIPPLRALPVNTSTQRCKYPKPGSNKTSINTFSPFLLPDNFLILRLLSYLDLNSILYLAAVNSRLRSVIQSKFRYLNSSMVYSHVSVTKNNNRLFSVVARQTTHLNLKPLKQLLTPSLVIVITQYIPKLVELHLLAQYTSYSILLKFTESCPNLQYIIVTKPIGYWKEQFLFDICEFESHYNSIHIKVVVENLFTPFCWYKPKPNCLPPTYTGNFFDWAAKPKNILLPRALGPELIECPDI